MFKGKKKSESGLVKKKAVNGIKLDPKGIRCPSCKVKGGLVAICIVTVKAPLAKGGGIKMAGIKVNAGTAKAAWDAQEKTIVCIKCNEKFVYEDGLKKLGSNDVESEE